MLIALVTAHTISGTIIDPGSNEAEWEAENFIKGLEERLMGKIRDLYKRMREDAAKGHIVDVKEV